MAGCTGTSPGYRSISLTTQSESVPLVEAIRLATGCPLIFSGVVKTSETNARTSGRPDASRWSSTSHRDQDSSSMGRVRKGTGFNGSETYSSNTASPGVGAAKLNFKPAFRWGGVGLTLQPVAHPAGHAGRRSHLLVPVSKAETGATSAFGAPSFKY